MFTIFESHVFYQHEVYLQITRYEMTQSSCKRDTKSKSHPGMKLAPVRVFSCKHPLRFRASIRSFMVMKLLMPILFVILALEPRTLTRWDVHKYARQAYDLGVRYIGGCCGFEPYHIRAIAEEVSSRKRVEKLNLLKVAVLLTFRVQCIGGLPFDQTSVPPLFKFSHN